jgi:hypothetical protein
VLFVLSLFVLATIPPDYVRPSGVDDRFEFARQKYVKKKWIDPNMIVPFQVLIGDLYYYFG